MIGIEILLTMQEVTQLLSESIDPIESLNHLVLAEGNRLTLFLRGNGIYGMYKNALFLGTISIKNIEEKIWTDEERVFNRLSHTGNPAEIEIRIVHKETQRLKKYTLY